MKGAVVTGSLYSSVAAKKLQDQFIQRCSGMLQSSHVDLCMQAWEVWMALMEASKELDGIYGTKAILAHFVSCLKPKTQVVELQVKPGPTNIWEAMNTEQEVDLLIFEADSPSSSPSHTPFQNCSNTPGTPGCTLQKPHVRFTPPANQEATDTELAAAGFQHGNSGGLSGGNADTVTYQGPYSSANPLPSMTQAWKVWCLKNRVCFFCSKPQAGHLSSDCPEFPAMHAVNGSDDLIDLSD
eukprot:3274551-Rhodomonas_salina.1